MDKERLDMGMDGVSLSPYDAHANVDSLCGLVKVVYLPL
jgi:hypothetical protein